MAVTADQVVVELSAKVDDYNSKIDASSANFNKRMIDIEASSARAGYAIGSTLRAGIAAFGAAQLFQIAKGALAYASSLGEVAQQIGVTTRELQAFQYAGSQVGLTNEETREGLTKLTRTLGEAATGSEHAQKALMLIGYSQKELQSGSIKTGDAVRKIADFLAKIPSPTQRAAVELELFGRAGQRLDTLLSGGSSAIDELSQAAEKLGIVLSDEQIQSADDTADKLESVKRVLEANIAGVVANNASSILGLANALGTLTGQILQFLSSNPQAALTIIGGLAGARFGPVGAAIGGAGGYAAGGRLAQNQADQNNDINFRRRALAASMHQAVNRGRAEMGGGGGLLSFRHQAGEQLAGNYADALKEVKRQQALYDAALKASKKPPSPGPADPKLAAQLSHLNAAAGPKGGAGGGGGAESAADKAKRAAEQIAREQARYADDLARAHSDQLDAQAELTQSTEDRYTAEMGRIAEDRANSERDAAAEKGITEAQRATLIAEREKGLKIREQIATKERHRALDEDAFRVAQAASGAVQEEIQGRISLATTVRERRDLELQLLEERKKAERDYLQNMLKTSPASSSDHAIAAAGLASIDSRYDVKREQTDQQNRGPWGDYLAGLPHTADQVNEALERAAANGAARLNDQLAESLTNMIGLHGAAGDFLSDLIKIGLQMAQAALFGDGAGGGGGFGSFLSSIGQAASSVFGGGRASGGYVGAGQLVRVNEGSSPGNVEGWRPMGSGTVIPLGLMKAAAPAGNTTVIHAPQFNLKGAVVTAELYRDMQDISNRSAVQAGKAAYQQSMQDAPASVSRARRYGTRGS